MEIEGKKQLDTTNEYKYEYKIVAGYDIKTLEEEVNKLLNNGFTLSAFTVTDYDYSHNGRPVWYTQSLVRKYI